MASPEHALQVTVARMLGDRLPPEVHWIAGMAGVRLTPRVRAKAKAAACLRRGWPDLSFALPDGRTAYIELKVKASLSPEQRAFREIMAPHELWALCRSVEDVTAALHGWGVALRPHPFWPDPLAPWTAGA